MGTRQRGGFSVSFFQIFEIKHNQSNLKYVESWTDTIVQLSGSKKDSNQVDLTFFDENFTIVSDHDLRIVAVAERN